MLIYHGCDNLKHLFSDFICRLGIQPVIELVFENVFEIYYLKTNNCRKTRMMWHARPFGCGWWLPEDIKLKRGMEGENVLNGTPYLYTKPYILYHPCVPCIYYPRYCILYSLILFLVMDLSYFLYRVTGMNFIFIFLNLLQPIMVELLLSDFLLGGGGIPQDLSYF